MGFIFKGLYLLLISEVVNYWALYIPSYDNTKSLFIIILAPTTTRKVTALRSGGGEKKKKRPVEADYI